MKIVDRATFLKMPAGTVYQKYESCFFDSINVKGDTCGENDWVYLCGIEQPDFPEATDSASWFGCCWAMEKGESKDLYFEVSERDGLFDEDQLFAVWEPDDIRGLIGVLEDALARLSPSNGASQ
jgi:hypothetical protein